MPHVPKPAPCTHGAIVEGSVASDGLQPGPQAVVRAMDSSREPCHESPPQMMSKGL